MKKTKVKNVNNEKGITLVALVVTIIVLMILAGITLTLVLGQNGIISKAQQAKMDSLNDQEATSAGLNNLYDYISNETVGTTDEGSNTNIITGEDTIPTIESVKTGNTISSTNNTAIKDDEGNTVTIPAGFKIAIDSATKQEDGIVIEDKDGNQYVWIPVADISDYARTNFGINLGDYSNYSEAMPSDEQTSVSTYHGYYIGRYEAGDVTSTANKTLRASGASVTNKVSIKKGQAPYNFITIDQAQTLTTGIKIVEGYKATTQLCSSYAWDTAVNFIQDKVANYGTTSPQGNYKDTTFSYTDITGAIQTKATNISVLIPTGQTTPVCNIYDMEGNDLEWTTEACSVSGYPCVPCGGDYYDYYASFPAGYRWYSAADPRSDIGFRVTLYM